jgi:hypothetical protein
MIVLGLGAVLTSSMTLTAVFVLSRIDDARQRATLRVL